MKTIQIILDVEVSDDALTSATVLHRWKNEFAYPTLMAGVVVSKAVALPVPELDAIPQQHDSLNVYPGVSTRLLTAARNAELFTIRDLAAALPEFMKFRNVGDGVMKEAIRICVEARAPFPWSSYCPRTAAMPSSCWNWRPLPRKLRNNTGQSTVYQR